MSHTITMVTQPSFGSQITEIKCAACNVMWLLCEPVLLIEPPAESGQCLSSCANLSGSTVCQDWSGEILVSSSKYMQNRFLLLITLELLHTQWHHRWNVRGKVGSSTGNYQISQKPLCIVAFNGSTAVTYMPLWACWPQDYVLLVSLYKVRM